MTRYLAVLILVLVCAVPIVGTAAPAPSIMPLSEIKPGMRGIGKTVIHGQTPDDYQFEVIDILQAGGGPVGADKLIMLRMYGPLAERTGGGASGMSGSPLYINGKLIGAQSASFSWQAPANDIVLGTPIEEMLKVLDRRSPRSSRPAEYRASRPFMINGNWFDRVVVASDFFQARRLVAQPAAGVAVAAPSVATFASGFSPRAGRLLAQVVTPLGHEILQGHGGRGDFVAKPIVPGSAVGIEEVRGDVAFGGICTVTTRIGNRILVCGHPWENQGDVEYILSAAEILTVVRSPRHSFKVGNLGQVIGLIDQDRGTAIAGVIGPLPRLFNVRVVVTDQDLGSRIQLGAQMVRRRDMSRVLAPLVALSAIEKARNQGPGEGTAIVKLTLRAKGLPSPIVREDMFFSTTDVATASVLDVIDAMELAFYNDLRDLEPYDLTVETVITKKRITASIVDVELSSREVSPGGLLRVRVTLQPYRAERPVSRVVDVQVPRDFPRGPATLVVRSAGGDPAGAPPEAFLGRALGSEPQPWGVDSLETALRVFENAGKNTDILVRIQPFGLPTTPQDFTAFDVPAGRVVRTDWVIQGTDRIPILIR